MPIATGTEAAFLRVDPAGTVTATFSVAPQGQGHETTLAQVVADALGVSFDSVRVICGDTALAPHGTGTYASRSAVLAGGAAIRAGQSLKEKALKIAGHMMESNPADLDIQDGQVFIRDKPECRLPFREVAQTAYAGLRRLPKDMEPGLEVTRFYDPFFGTASSATHVAVVEVDTETYAVTVKRYIVVEDCGRIINPLIVEGQVRGGVAQGIGAALYEEVVYDDAGQLLTGSLVDYLVPNRLRTPAHRSPSHRDALPHHAGRISWHGRGRHHRRAGRDCQRGLRRPVSFGHRDKRDSDYTGEIILAGAGGGRRALVFFQRL